MKPAIILRDAAVMRGRRRVISDVGLSVGAGSWFGLMGANGSGKTSLLRAFAGRLPFAAGTCVVDDTECAGDRFARARLFGFAVPAERLPDMLRVRDLLRYAAGDADTAMRRMGSVAEALSIDALAPRWIGDCSAGMRQRVAIALAFAGGQRHVILDEPFNWLDPVAAFDLRQALRLRVDAGLTLVTALHDMATLLGACDEALLLAGGRVALGIDRAMLTAAASAPARFEQEMIAMLRVQGGNAGVSARN